MRIKSHEIDTQARKIVPLALPKEWEYRDITGRDYGIDMEVEIFENGNATGQVLLFQIKGTGKDIFFKNGVSGYDIPTKTLIYSERFVTPFILAICPIYNKKQIFYYIWMQDYIKSVLNFDNLDWRKNKTTTRVFFPEDNCMLGKEKHLSFISHFPQRLYGACEVARILHNLQSVLDGEPRPYDFERVAKELENILNMPGYLARDWQHGKFIKEQYLEPAILAAKLLSDQKEPNEAELKLFPSISSFNARNKNGIDWIEHEELLQFQLKCQVSHGLNCMSFFYEETNYSLKNFLWKEELLHNF